MAIETSVAMPQEVAIGFYFQWQQESLLPWQQRSLLPAIEDKWLAIEVLIAIGNRGGNRGPVSNGNRDSCCHGNRMAIESFIAMATETPVSMAIEVAIETAIESFCGATPH